MARRVVITGMGIWSCLGDNLSEVTESLRTGRSGIDIDPERLSYGYKSALTGIVKKPDLKKIVDRRTRMGLSQQAEYAVMASREAFQTAGIDDEYLKANEVGIIFGNDSSIAPSMQLNQIMEEYHDTMMIGSGLIFQGMNSSVSMNLSILFHLRGVNLSVSAACASGSHAIGLAYMYIQQGFQDIILCGGAQEVNKYAMSTFDALDAFSKRQDDPTKASRPFDSARDGLVPSGGAAALIIEDYEHAIARNATILAEICGYGFSSNGEGICQSSSEGSVVAMTRAMQNAGVTADEIDYVNAHATSTPSGDKAEAIALNQLFSGKKAWISSTKSMTGHECWMAGSSEVIYTVLMMQHGFVAPNINFENPDEYSAPLKLATKTIETPIELALSNSFGFGGTNAALVIRRL